MPPVVFRSMFNRVLSVLAWLLLAGVAVTTALSPGAFPALRGVPVGAAGIAALVWVTLWAPYVRVDDDGIRVANIFLEHTIPWAALIHVDTQYSLTLHTPRKRIRATAAPAPGQLTAFRATRAEKRRLGKLGTTGVRPGDLPGTDSGSAAELVRDRWETLKVAGRIEAGIADATPVTTHARPIEIAAFALGTAALIAAILMV